MIHRTMVVRPRPPAPVSRVPLAHMVFASVPDAEPSPEAKKRKSKPRTRTPPATSLYVRDKFKEAVKLFPDGSSISRMNWVMAEWSKASDEERLPYEEESKRLQVERDVVKAEIKNQRPLSAYQLFTKAFMAEARKADSSLTSNEVFKQVGPAWKALPVEQIAEYQKQAAARNDVLRMKREGQNK